MTIVRAPRVQMRLARGPMGPGLRIPAGSAARHAAAAKASAGMPLRYDLGYDLVPFYMVAMSHRTTIKCASPAGLWAPGFYGHPRGISLRGGTSRRPLRASGGHAL